MQKNIFGERNLLLVFNPQQDYMDLGNVPVLGAIEAIRELSSWIRTEALHITDILIFLNSHGPCDFPLPSAWTDKSGKILDPLTVITSQSVKQGHYIPQYVSKEVAIEYLDKLEKLGKNLVIRPKYCQEGSHGASIPQDLVDALGIWSEKNQGKHWIVRKFDQGLDREYISPFRNTIQEPSRSDMLDNIFSGHFDKIFMAGLPKDRCISEVLVDIKDIKGQDGFKSLVLLDFAMASLNKKATSLDIFSEAVTHGSINLEKR